MNFNYFRENLFSDDRETTTNRLFVGWFSTLTEPLSELGTLIRTIFGRNENAYKKCTFIRTICSRTEVFG